MTMEPSVFVVDDEILIGMDTATILQQSGYAAEAIPSAEECLRRLDNGERPDLVLMDIDLGRGRMDGTAAAARIQQVHDIPVVFHSGHTDEATIAKTKNVTNYGYVQKTPGNAQFLLATIELALKLHYTKQEHFRSEQRFRRIFEYTPVAIWEEDISEVRRELHSLRNRGVRDLGQYFEQNPDEIDRLASLIKIIDVNEVTVRMLGATHKNEILTSVDQFTTPETRNILRTEFLALWEGKSSVEEESTNRTLDGRVLDLLIMISNPPEELGGDTLLVSTIDITRRNTLQKELQASNQRLHHTLDEKEYLLREIHHRVKNNLNVVASLIKLKAAEQEDGDESFEEIYNQVTAIMTLHEMLYQSEEMTSVHLGSYLQKLLESLFSSLSEQPVELESDLIELRISPDSAIPLALATNEIAINAIQHGFLPDSPARFRLSMRTIDNDAALELTLANSGAPFPDNVDFAHADTLGLRLVDSLIQQLNGQARIKRNGETCFVLTIPLDEENLQ